MENNYNQMNQNGFEQPIGPGPGPGPGYQPGPNPQGYSSYQQPPQPQVNNYYSPSSQVNEVVTVGQWIGTMLLLCIPLVNIILVFVWAFSSTIPKSKSNLMKAALIMWLIGIVIGIILAFTGAFAGLAMLNQYGY